MSKFLVCGKCGEKLTGVVDSRPNYEGNATMRRRRCEKCKARWTTYEISARDYQQIMPLLGEVAAIARLRSKMEVLLQETEYILKRISEVRRIKARKPIPKSEPASIPTNGTQYSSSHGHPRPTTGRLPVP